METSQSFGKSRKNVNYMNDFNILSREPCELIAFLSSSSTAIEHVHEQLRALEKSYLAQ